MSSEMRQTDMTLRNVRHLHVYQILALEAQHAWKIRTSGAANVHQGTPVSSVVPV